MPIAINIWLAPRATASRTCFIGVTFAVINPSGNCINTHIRFIVANKAVLEGNDREVQGEDVGIGIGAYSVTLRCYREGIARRK